MAYGFTFKRTYIPVIALLIACVALLAFLTYQRLSPSGFLSDLQNDLQNIDPLPGQGYTDLSGNPVDLRTYKGKVLVINSWASWMPFSQTELPLLNQIKERYGDSVTLLAINRMEDRALIQTYLGTLPSMPSAVFLADPADTFYRAVGGYAMPETVIYAADGTIAAHIRGVFVEAELVATLDALVGE